MYNVTKNIFLANFLLILIINKINKPLINFILAELLENYLQKVQIKTFTSQSMSKLLKSVFIEVYLLLQLLLFPEMQVNENRTLESIHRNRE